MQKNAKASSVIMAVAAISFVVLALVALSVPEKSNMGQQEDILSYATYVHLGEYKGLESTVQRTIVADSEVEEAYKEFIRQRGGSYEEDDGVVDDGDKVSLTYTNITHDEEAYPADGIIGNGDLPADFESALIGLSAGDETYLDFTNGGGDKYRLTVIKVYKPSEVTDEFIKTLGVGEIVTVDGLKEYIRELLQEQNDEKYKEEVKEDLAEKVYSDCEFAKMPDELIAPFKAVTQKRVANLLAQYAQSGAVMTEEELLKDTIEQGGFASIDEYYTAQAERDARIYAMCLAIAEKEHIEAEEKKVYSLAATDWAEVKDAYPTLIVFLESNDIEVYRRSVLSDSVFEYIYNSSSNSEVNE